MATTTEKAAKLAEFVTWVGTHITGDEKGEAQIFLDRLFKGFGHAGWKEAGATCEKRIKNDNGGTSFADLVWKPAVVIEMKKRGADLTKHYSQSAVPWCKAAQAYIRCRLREYSSRRIPRSARYGGLLCVLVPPCA